MFKNMMMYRITTPWSADVVPMESCLQAARFVPCGATQEKSVGWVEPRAIAHAALVEALAGQRVLKLMIESKSVPSAVIRRYTEERLAQIEASTGRKPGKKETRDIKQDIKLSLLPHAFAKQAAVWIWLDPQSGLLVLDAASQGKADEALSALVRTFEGLSLAPLNTALSPAAAMSQWLISQQPPPGFSVDRECELKAADESRALVRYSRHALDNDEVCAHVQAGKLPTRLALTWNDRVSFLLTESLQLKKVTLQHLVQDDVASADDTGFDADVLIATSELRGVLADLVQALGGELAREATPGT